MAVDTANKRGSAIRIASPYLIVLPEPDVGAEGVGDRQQLAFAYASGDVSAGQTAGGYTMAFIMSVIWEF